MTPDAANPDWQEWHREYDDPASRLSRRLTVVQAHIRHEIGSRVGALRIVSMCSGEGRDLIGVLAGHDRRDDVMATLIELEPAIAVIARDAATRAGLAGVHVECADAALSDSYAGAVPADIVLACGIFGNISGGDIRRTVEHLPALCAARATVIWTRGRSRERDVTPAIRGWFRDAGFEERRFDAPADETFSVGSHRLVAAPQPLRPGVRMFRFVTA